MAGNSYGNASLKTWGSSRDLKDRSESEFLMC